MMVLMPASRMQAITVWRVLLSEPLHSSRRLWLSALFQINSFTAARPLAVTVEGTCTPYCFHIFAPELEPVKPRQCIAIESKRIYISGFVNKFKKTFVQTTGSLCAVRYRRNRWKRHAIRKEMRWARNMLNQYRPPFPQWLSEDRSTLERKYWTPRTEQ